MIFDDNFGWLVYEYCRKFYASNHGNMKKSGNKKYYGAKKIIIGRKSWFYIGRVKPQ
jgi:hypothetical protein